MPPSKHHTYKEQKDVYRFLISAYYATWNLLDFFVDLIGASDKEDILKVMCEFKYGNKTLFRSKEYSVVLAHYVPFFNYIEKNAGGEEEILKSLRKVRGFFYKREINCHVPVEDGEYTLKINTRKILDRYIRAYFNDKYKELVNNNIEDILNFLSHIAFFKFPKGTKGSCVLFDSLTYGNKRKRYMLRKRLPIEDSRRYWIVVILEREERDLFSVVTFYVDDKDSSLTLKTKTDTHSNRILNSLLSLPTYNPNPRK